MRSGQGSAGRGRGGAVARERPAWVDVTAPPAAPASVNDQLRAEFAARGEAVETLRLSASAAAHVDAYLEYHRVVGDYGDAPLLSEAEYEAFQARAVAERASRLYVSWRNADGLDCKNVGPSTLCFCGHVYRQHATDNLRGKQRHAKDVRCGVAGCGCELFDYVPAHGTWGVKCTCKHEAAQHNPRTRRCTVKSCGCGGFASSFSCGCGQPYGAHTTAIETRDERAAAGRPVDNLAGGGAGYEALGGITSFAALADGYERAGAGAGSSAGLPFSEAVGRLRIEDPEAAEALMAAAAAPPRRLAAGPPPGQEGRAFWWLEDSAKQQPRPQLGHRRPAPPAAAGAGGSGAGGRSAASGSAGGGAAAAPVAAAPSLSVDGASAGRAGSARGGAGSGASDALARLKAQRRGAQ